MQLSDDGARRLVAAALLCAVQDAQRGDGAALAWLVETGATWADALLDFRLDVSRLVIETRPLSPALSRLAALMAERPDMGVAELSVALGLAKQTVKNYRHELLLLQLDLPADLPYYNPSSTPRTRPGAERPRPGFGSALIDGSHWDRCIGALFVCPDAERLQ